MMQEVTTADSSRAVEPITATLYWDTRVCSVCDGEQCDCIDAPGIRLLYSGPMHSPVLGAIDDGMRSLLHQHKSIGRRHLIDIDDGS